MKKLILKCQDERWYRGIPQRAHSVRPRFQSSLTSTPWLRYRGTIVRIGGSVGEDTTGAGALSDRHDGETSCYRGGYSRPLAGPISHSLIHTPAQAEQRCVHEDALMLPNPSPTEGKFCTAFRLPDLTSRRGAAVAASLPETAEPCAWYASTSSHPPARQAEIPYVKEDRSIGFCEIPRVCDHGRVYDGGGPTRRVLGVQRIAMSRKCALRDSGKRLQEAVEATRQSLTPGTQTLVPRGLDTSRSEVKCGSAP